MLRRDPGRERSFRMQLAEKVKVLAAVQASRPDWNVLDTNHVTVPFTTGFRCSCDLVTLLASRMAHS